MLIRYRLYVVKAAEILWDTQSRGQRNPNPFVNVYFEGKLIFSTTTKQQTLAPMWDERVELESDNPTSKLSFDLCHRGTTSGEELSIGTKELTIMQLEDRAMFNPNLSVILHDHDDRKTGIMAVRLVKEAPPVSGRKESTTTVIPRELPPELKAAAKPAGATKVTQVVGFSEQSVSMEQARRVVRQILARSSAVTST